MTLTVLANAVYGQPFTKLTSDAAGDLFGLYGDDGDGYGGATL